MALMKTLYEKKQFVFQMEIVRVAHVAEEGGHNSDSVESSHSQEGKSVVSNCEMKTQKRNVEHPERGNLDLWQRK